MKVWDEGYEVADADHHLVAKKMTKDWKCNYKGFMEEALCKTGIKEK